MKKLLIKKLLIWIFFMSIAGAFGTPVLLDIEIDGRFPYEVLILLVIISSILGIVCAHDLTCKDSKDRFYPD